MGDPASQITRGALRYVGSIPRPPSFSLPRPQNIVADLDRYSAIFNSTVPPPQYSVPVLQCLQVKPLAAPPSGGPERYRVVLSDINNYVQCMLATQANHVIHDGKLVKGCIARIKSFQSNNVRGKKYVVLDDIACPTLH